MPKDLPWLDAIEKVLREYGAAMHYKDIAEHIVTLGLRTKVGATPANAVNAYLNKSIRDDGDKSPFLIVQRGEFILREHASAGQGVTIPKDDEADTEQQYSIITSFGMFWRREQINWQSTPKLLGMQQIGAQPVDFYKQIGIYLLYDGREVIYVGRASERPIGKRLYEHTWDRLSARWDRFSWFGLSPVNEDGSLGTLPANFSSIPLIPALEAMLVEALEPRQNRKRGDDLAAVEFLQDTDPELRKRQTKEILAQALERM